MIDLTHKTSTASASSFVIWSSVKLPSSTKLCDYKATSMELISEVFTCFISETNVCQYSESLVIESQSSFFEMSLRASYDKGT